MNPPYVLFTFSLFATFLSQALVQMSITSCAVTIYLLIYHIFSISTDPTKSYLGHLSFHVGVLQHGVAAEEGKQSLNWDWGG